MTTEKWDKDQGLNRLHADDIALIVSGVTGSINNHYCRFSAITTEDMQSIVPFMIKFKRLSEKIGSVVLIVVVTAITGGCLALMSLGFWTKRGG